MAIRSTASVVATVKRRGVGALGVDDFIWLQENKGEVKKVQALLKQHGEDALAAEQKAREAESSATNSLAKLREAAAELDQRLAEFEKSATEVLTKQQAATELLTRRLKAAKDQNSAADSRMTALDARAKALDAQERDRETELSAREEVLETRESRAEEREEAQLNLAADLKKRQSTIETAAKMLKQAAASLG